jgi:hypothetical protein
MDATTPTFDATADVNFVPREPSAAELQRRTELIVEALRLALSEPGEKRLFRAGKLPGLFPQRFGPAAEAALFALKQGLIETTRTEAKGRSITEWVRPTSRGLTFLHDHDSPKAVLQDLKAAIGPTRAGLPTWMAEAQAQIAELTRLFQVQTQEMLNRLNEINQRIEAALQRVEGPSDPLPDSAAAVIPWSREALAYLDRRTFTGLPGPCPFADLFHALLEAHPALSLKQFHDGLRRLNDLRAVKLIAAPAGKLPDPEYAILVGAELCGFVQR